jgi:pilus assembly protein CpaE
MENIRVLLLAIFPRVEQRIRTLLNSIPTVELISGDINNAEAALEVVFTEKPDIILLENDFPGMDGAYLTQLIRKELPATQIIVLSEISSAEAVRQAMRAGACEYLSYKTVSLEELSAAIDHAYSLYKQERLKRKMSSDDGHAIAKKGKRQRARIVTFYSPKGGTGVSTIIVNLAHTLQKGGKKVLIIDGDLQYGDIALLNKELVTRTIADIADKSNALDDDIFKNVLIFTRPDILPAPSQPDQAVRITGPAFEKIINHVAMMEYDIILINTSSYITDPCFIALELADVIYLVVIQDISSVRATRSFLNLTHEIDIGRNKIQLILNRFDEDSSVTPTRISDILGLKISLTLPQDVSTATRAGNLGIPFVTEYGNLPISKSISTLASHLNMLVDKLEPLPFEEAKDTAR